MNRIVLCCVLLMVASGCSDPKSNSYAGRISSPLELIGGPGALGMPGDYLIGNQKIRVIIQDKGWSRGFGVFGGGIIDADIIRPGDHGSTDRGSGRDNFGETFPTLFMQAFDVQDRSRFDTELGQYATLPAVEVIHDGSDGKPATIRTRSAGGDFLMLISTILDLAIPERGLEFETDYIVRPGARHVEIVGRLINTGTSTLDFSGSLLTSLLGGDQQVPLPLGDVLLFGSGNHVFAPGGVGIVDAPGVIKPTGFDLRYAVEAAVQAYSSYGVTLPAMPGLVTDFLATSGEGVSYGFAAAPSDTNYAWIHRDKYNLDSQAEVTQESLFVPFLFSAFTGAFYNHPPATLAVGETFEYTRYFLIGDGDVGSIRDELYNIRDKMTGEFSGRVRNEVTGAPEADAEIHILDYAGRPFSQVKPGPDGRFKTNLEPGDYYYVVTAPGRFPYPDKDNRLSELNAFQLIAKRNKDDAVTAIQGAYRDIRIPAPAELAVEVRDQDGRLVPARVSVVASHSIPQSCRECKEDCDPVCVPRSYLFDFSLAEERRSTDLGWRSQQDIDYIETTFLTEAGIGGGNVRPGLYDVYVSRGVEYDLFTKRGVQLNAGTRTELKATLTRSVETEDYISADLHVHQLYSLDSSVKLDERVRAIAAEGLEVAVATDHNYVTNYEPTIATLGLSDWVRGIAGVELSTTEAGHFAAFPLEYNVGTSSKFPYVETCYEPHADQTNQTAFDWRECSPEQLFAYLRDLGQYNWDETIVQINHPRDSILGYFSQYYMSPYSGLPQEPDNRNHSLVEEPTRIRSHNDTTDQFEVSKFSLNFDAIEILNGTRQDALHAFVVPETASDEFVAELQDYNCEDGHPDNGRGKPLLRNGGYIAYPGVVDDWMNLLNLGYKFTGTGNSDSHDLHEEVGYPRNYIYIQPNADGTPRDNHPHTVHELDVVYGLLGNRNLVTNGPFLNMAVITQASTPAEDGSSNIVWPVGDTVRYGTCNAGKTVDIAFALKSADWVKIDTIRLYANGEVIDEIAVPTSQNAEGRDVDDNTIISRSYVFGELGKCDSTDLSDAWIVAEAVGSQSLFPVVSPREDTPANLSLVLNAFSSSLGFDAAGFASGDGTTGPDFIQLATPYAITNPIWLDIDGDGVFTPSGNPAAPGPAPDKDPTVECEDDAGTKSGGHTKHSRVPLTQRRVTEGAHYERGDIRAIFDGMHGH